VGNKANPRRRRGVTASAPRNRRNDPPERSDTELRMSEATLLNILEASPDAISLNRLSDLRYVAVNSVFIEATGIDVEDALSKTPDQLGIWQDKSQFEEFMRRVKADGAVKDMEVDFRGRGQQVLSTLTSAVVVVIDETPCIVSFTRDISKLKEAERKRIESESTFRKIIESSPDAIAIIEFATGRYIEGNDAFLHATGLRKEELLNTTVRQLGIWKNEKTLRESLRALREAGVIRSQPIDIKHSSGRRSPYLFSAVLADIGEKKCAVVIGQDVTDIREAENKLKAARQAALDADKAKSEFLSNMSHEIRTPMNAILGMADLLARTPLSEDQRRFVELMRVNGDALLDLINDILDLAKIESGRLTIESTGLDLEELIEKVGEAMAIRAHEKGLELAVYSAPDVPTNLIGDPLRLRQILFNLLGNAIKFTERGEVSLTVEREHTEKRDESRIGDRLNSPISLRFSVADTGVGVASDKLESIFSSFEQADSSTTRKYGGTGLGLAIAKRLVQLHGGKITVKSQPGKGSCFSFTAKFGIDALPTVKSQENVGLNGARVMVADDTTLNRTVIRKNIEREGAMLVDFSDLDGAFVELGLARAAGHPYQLIILDCAEPDMGRIEALLELGGIDQKQTRIVAMLTSDNMSAKIVRLARMGITAYLVKPIRRADLLRAIASAMGTNKVDSAVAAEDTRIHNRKLPPLHVLLADDSPVNRLLIKAYFNGTPIKLDEAENGQIAQNKFKAGKFDLVLMDMRMPVMDGYAATRSIREWEQTNQLARTPIIALTASALEEEVRKSLQAGCDAHLSKPVKRGTLLDAIAEAIE
jgi:two-component system, sensor histidine kinase and response regulator